MNNDDIRLLGQIFSNNLPMSNIIENLGDEEAFSIYIQLQRRFDPKKYRFRNRPITEAEEKDGKHLCIVGQQKSVMGGGVLEWCANEDEARLALIEMQKDSDFESLSIDWV